MSMMNWGSASGSREETKAESRSVISMFLTSGIYSERKGQFIDSEDQGKSLIGSDREKGRRVERDKEMTTSLLSRDNAPVIS